MAAETLQDDLDQLEPPESELAVPAGWGVGMGGDQGYPKEQSLKDQRARERKRCREKGYLREAEKEAPWEAKTRRESAAAGKSNALWKLRGRTRRQRGKAAAIPLGEFW